MAAKKRYWTYVHDKNGDLISDLGETDSLRDALDGAAEEIRDWYNNDMLGERGPSWTVRVVDNNLQFGGTTIWMAGPVVQVKSVAADS